MADPLVALETYEYLPEAATAKALLEVSGLHPVLLGAEANSIWASRVAQVKLEIPQVEADAARRVLAKIQRWDESGSKRSADDPDACLECGAPMDRGARECAKCGWSYAGEETTDYENGPVPDSLLPFARSPLDSHRFGMKAAAATRYARWCEQEELEISGFEAWQASGCAHDVVARVDSATGADMLAAIPRILQRHGDVLFSPLVRKETEVDAG